MKKTITSLALLASATSAQALIGPGGPRPVYNTYCLSNYETQDGQIYAGDCDLKDQNKRSGVEITETGCAEDQVAIVTVKKLNIKACPTFVQL